MAKVCNEEVGIATDLTLVYRPGERVRCFALQVERCNYRCLFLLLCLCCVFRT